MRFWQSSLACAAGAVRNKAAAKARPSRLPEGACDLRVIVSPKMECDSERENGWTRSPNCKLSRKGKCSAKLRKLKAKGLCGVLEWKFFSRPAETGPPACGTFPGPCGFCRRLPPRCRRIEDCRNLPG